MRVICTVHRVHVETDGAQRRRQERDADLRIAGWEALLTRLTFSAMPRLQLLHLFGSRSTFEDADELAAVGTMLNVTLGFVDRVFKTVQVSCNIFFGQGSAVAKAAIQV